MTPDDVQVRRDICAACRRDCPERDTIAHADPCAACPVREWHALGDCAAPSTTPCQSPDQPPVGVAISIARPFGQPTLARRVRGYARAGQLVDTATRHRRRDACAACASSLPTNHRGLYRCNASRCGCAGGDEIRLALKRTTCANWVDISAKTP